MLRRTATLLTAAIAFGALSIFAGVANRTASDSPLDVLSLQTSFTPDRFTAVAEPWGVEGITDFRRNLFVVDLAYPVAYALLLMTLMARFTPEAPRWARWAPAAAAGADWLENGLHAIGLSRLIGGETAPAWAVVTGSSFAVIKWLLLLGSLLVIARHARRDHPTLGATCSGIALFLLAALLFSI